MKKTIHQDLWVALVLLAIEVYFYGLTSTFAVAETTALLPKLAIGGMILFTLAMAIRAIFLTVKGKGVTLIHLKTMKMSLIAYLIFVAYVVVFWTTNYFIAAPLLIIGLFLFLGFRDLKKIPLIVVAYLVMVFVVFVKVLGITKLL